MSDGDLRALMQQAKETLSERITRRLDEFKQLAQEAGFEIMLRKIGEGDGPRRRRRSQAEAEGADHRREVAPKYRNPGNPAETWSGRGRKPRWVEEQVAAGRGLSDLLIHPELASQTAQ
jgi:DNA-binding protein H-NS